MTLHKETSSRERILLYGVWGSGKSEAWCRIAEYLRKTTPSPKVYVGDTDMAVDRMSERWADWDVNVVSTDLESWSDYSTWAAKNRAIGKPDDWLVCDMVDKAWEAVQSEFVDKAFGKDIDEWFLDFRKENPSGGHALAGSYGTNWTVINKMYQKFIMNVLRFPGHVLVCAPADPVQQPDRSGKGGDSELIREMYGRAGLKPKGQKSLGHQFSTVILMQDSGKGWKMNSVKDRGRELMKGADNTDFVINYLVKVAGWKL